MTELFGEAATDIPRIFTAAAEWGACLVYISLNRRRAGWLLTGVVALIALLVLCAVQTWAGTLSLALWIPGMVAAALVMLLFVVVTSRTTVVTAGYLTARAFVLAELVASVHWQLDRFYLTSAPRGWQVAFLIIVYAAVLGSAWLVERRHFSAQEAFYVGARELISALAIAAATFAISNLSFATVDTAFSGRLGPEISYIRTLVDLCGFIALYVQHQLRREMQTRADAESMAQLIRNQHEQYEISRRAIEDVDRKYHDMKHHLDALRGEISQDARVKALDELERSISAYSDQVRTGNGVVDAVLSATRMRAREAQVELSSVVDGALVDFLGVLDITTILGNALDNALEGAQRVTAAERRLIRVAIFAQDDFVVIRVENTFDGTVVRRDGAIVTRKSESGHGYGLRNIEAAVERYDGTATTSADDDWFALVLLIPGPAADQPV